MRNQVLQEGAHTSSTGASRREIHVDAALEVVFEVIGRPDHLQELFPDEADLRPTPGAIGELAVTRQAVAKHLGVLDRVGLVHVRPSGREKRYQVDQAQLERAVAQLSPSRPPGTPGYERIMGIAEVIQRSREQ